MWLLSILLIFIGDGLGEWVKCDDGWVGEQLLIDKYHFYDTPNFTVKSAVTETVAIRLCIKIEGNALTFLHIEKHSYV